MLTSKRTNDSHIALYRRAGGLLGGKVGETGVLLLTTIGRKSGQQRTIPLNYITDDPDYIVVASNSGRDKPPIWYLNLKSDPHATVEVKWDKTKVEAEIASPEERSRLWPIFTNVAPTYDMYQRRTAREIDMVILRPV